MMEFNAVSEKLYNIWYEHTLDTPDLAAELLQMRFDRERINDCFYKDLEFGTGGLRGLIGAGTNRMNIYTVAKASQGFSIYLNSHFGVPTVAIAYDSRKKSELFARVSAEVFAANGIHVFLYSELMPTPALSFAVRYHSCSGGIVITASHNPAPYNGYKVYGPDGCQITTTAAQKIQREIRNVDIFEDVKRIPFEEAVSKKMISYIGKETIQAYLEAVSEQSLWCGEAIDKNISIVYTPLNGTGLKCVLQCLKMNGFTNIHVVPEQEMPDGNFPTCPIPNPEIHEALSLGLRDAERLRSDLLLATDPDCDRVGIAVRNEEKYILLSGNEVGLLLFDYICKRRLDLHRMPINPVLVKTIVTTDLAKRIAADYGVQVTEVLTGFKFIGEQIGILEKSGETGRYIFGFEESYGYLSGSYVRDKDGVNGALLICEMAAYYKACGKNLAEILVELYMKYGYCLNTLHSYEFKGSSGLETMWEIMEAFRKSSMSEIGGKAITSVSDYKKSEIHYPNGETEKIFLPESDVLKYDLEGDCSIVIRPSGTEPKIKVYLSVNGNGQSDARDTESKLISDLERWF